MSIILWNKKYTETLALMLERFRVENPQYAGSKITYAGRLDPMAQGLMILLTDQDVHKKESFLGLDKVYEVDFILGVSTDTYDILGRITGTMDASNIDEGAVKEAINSLREIDEQIYPPYSSKTVNGKPLWQYTRQGKEPDYFPTKRVRISESLYCGVKRNNNLDTQIIRDISRVQGDFRQKVIIESWQKYTSLKNKNVYSMRIHASTGTYMRTLVETIGKRLGTGATTLRINRLQIGENVLT